MIADPAAGAAGAAQPAGAAEQAQPAAAEANNERPQQQLAAINPMMDYNPQLVRSYLLPNNDRYILEQEHMESLSAGGGLFGTPLVDLEGLKRRVLNIPANKHLH